MPKVVFDIEGGKPVTAECNVGDNLLELARRANVAIDAPCSGNGSCGKCRVKLTAGELDSIQTRHISDEEYAQGRFCAGHCLGLPEPDEDGGPVLPQGGCHL